MATTFETVRQELLRECKSLESFDFRRPIFCKSATWGPMPQRIQNSLLKGFEGDTKLLNASITDDEFKILMKAQIIPINTIAFSLISRLQLIQMSCQKISEEYKGTSSDINEFRFIVERYAVLLDILNKFKKCPSNGKVKNYEDVIQLSELCLQSAGTRFNWSELVDKKFSEMKKTDYVFDGEKSIRDQSSKNIMSAIDRSERSGLKGLRAFYSFCCEFVHPNVGDHISTSFAVKTKSITDGTKLIQRTISSLAAPLETQVQLAGDAKLIVEAYRFGKELLADLNSKKSELVNLVVQSNKVKRNRLHKSVKKNLKLFGRNELCPCGSGKTAFVCVKNVSAV